MWSFCSLFFDEGRESLLLTLLTVLRPGGTALVVAPARSGTFQMFASMCRPHFMVAIVEKYDVVVDECAQKVRLETASIVKTLSLWRTE